MRRIEPIQSLVNTLRSLFDYRPTDIKKPKVSGSVGRWYNSIGKFIGEMNGNPTEITLLKSFNTKRKPDYAILIGDDRLETFSSSREMKGFFPSPSRVASKFLKEEISSP